MDTNMKVVFADGESYDLYGYTDKKNVMSLHYPTAAGNLSGFIIYGKNGEVIKDCSDFTIRWDVVDQKKDRIYYTNDPGCRQTEPWPDLSDITEQDEPLNNEELTETVADLMYEVSLSQLGL